MAGPNLGVDPVPGNIGLLADADTVILLPFTEPDTVHPSDVAGTLEDLGPAAAATPAIADTGAWASAVTRSFTNGAAFVAGDQADATSLLTRDVSVQAIASFAADSAGGRWTVICRGRGHGLGAAEFVAFCAQVAPTGPTAWQLMQVSMDLAGTEESVVSDDFTPPPVDTPTLLTWTRRWVSSTSVVCRFYIGDQLISEETSAVGEIGGGTTGQTSIGARRFDPGGYGEYLEGNIDDLKVVSREMSHEEIRQTWARLTKHQPGGVETFRGLAPPGVVWSRSDGSDIGRLIKAAGQAIGFAAAKAHELRETFLPHAAYKDGISEWEKLVGLQSKERLGLGLRRQAVVARLQVENGYSVPKVQAVLAPAFDVDEADVNILEFSPTIEDDFSTLEIERWKAEPAAAWSIVADEVQLQAASGDLRFDHAYHNPHRIRMPVENEDGLIAQVKLSTYWAALPSSAIVGLQLYNRVTNDSLWFGVKNDGGTRKLGYVHFKDGVLGAFTALVDPSVDAAYYLRITRSALGNYLLYWSNVSFTAGVSAPLLGSIENVQYVGVGAMATTSPTGSTLTATFDDFLARGTTWKRAFRWYAFRDPGDPGNPDMEDAERIVQRIKPAHTEAHAITSRSFLVGNTNSRCGSTPLGAL